MANFAKFFSQNTRNIHAKSVAVGKFLRWVLLASERAPASPTSTASPLARAPPFTAMLQNSRCRESITFPIRKFFRSDVERIESAFPCLLGLTILLLQTIFVSKKAMKNGNHKTNSFNSSNSWSKKQSFLPSFQGGAGGRLFPLAKHG